MVNIKIHFNNRTLTLPVNPEELSHERSADNEEVKIIGLGTIVVKKDAGLKKLAIESFFPSNYSEFYTGVSPKACVDFINNIWKSAKVARITTEGLPINLNMYFVIDSFNFDDRAGEEDDIYYNLEIKEYIPYGARLINMQGVNSGIIESPNRVDNKPLVDQVYIVKNGDSLISITKRITGNTSNWNELYNINKVLIGNNPNLIYPGTKLVLPESWVKI